MFLVVNSAMITAEVAKPFSLNDDAKVLLFSPNTKNGLALICKNLLTRRSFCVNKSNS